MSRLAFWRGIVSISGGLRVLRHGRAELVSNDASAAIWPQVEGGCCEIEREQECNAPFEYSGGAIFLVARW